MLSKTCNNIKKWAPSHQRKSSDLSFQKFAVANGTAFSRIPRKENNLVRYRYTQIFRNLWLGIIVSFDFPPRIYEIFSWMVHLFLRFSRNFQGNFCAILLLFQNFRKNLVERKAPSAIAMSSWGFLGLNHT